MTLTPRPEAADTAASATARDFHQLRREGIGHVERAGSTHWTDYNSHDPGITILESLAYTITELAWRTGFGVEDLLASAAVGATPEQPYPHQAFPTARTILTVNPTTPRDLRRLLIDVDPVRNAWVRCRGCACEPVLPGVRGLYEVLLELEADPDVGDLNDRRVVRRRTVVDPEGRRHPLTLELRFPVWGHARRDLRRALAAGRDPFTLALAGPFRTTTGTTPVDDAEVRAHWHDVLYVDVDVTLGDGTVVAIPDVSLRLFGDSTVRRQTTVADLLAWLADATAEGFVDAYRRKLALADAAVRAATGVLHAHRNLDEDYCHVDLVEVVDVAVCADVQLAPDADVELVQARLWFETERYLDPPPEFWTLGELRERGLGAEEVFTGPELHTGFLTDQGLDDTDLRTELRVSDLLDRLMEIDGVVSVDNLLLTVYHPDGRPASGVSDPTWTGAALVFDPDRVTASWRLFLPSNHRPRLHRQLSRFSFQANGLPFAPRLDEAEDTLVELHGRSARPKLRAADLDLPLPLGRRRDLGSYHPFQHGLPATYGVGPAGLPSTATAERKAQALQLKAYLMVYEQVLRNAYAHLAHAADLFSLDPATGHTYATASLADSGIADLAQVIAATADAELPALVEGERTFLERRNRFLDHLLARFGESFGEYGLLLADLAGQAKARTDLIGDKIGFLRALPRLGHDRGRAFNRSLAPRHPDNVSGLQQRVSLLLGVPDRTFAWTAERDEAAPGFTHRLTLAEGADAVATFAPDAAVEAALIALLGGLGIDAAARPWRIHATHDALRLTVDTDDGSVTEQELSLPDAAASALMRALADAERALLARLVLPATYRVVADGAAWRIELGPADAPLGAVAPPFATRADAESFADASVTWAAHKRAIVVEHLLLRPKFPGDARYPACLDDAGDPCDDEDPYSFLLTYVLPGWIEGFTTNMTLRRFADRTILEQTPAHLVLKACWVGDQFERFEDAWYRWADADAAIDWSQEHLLDAVVEVLSGFAPPAATRGTLCACAASMLHEFGSQFAAWREANVAAGTPWGEFTTFAPPDPSPCAELSLQPGALGAVGNLLRARYSGWAEASYRLHVLVTALAALRNTYPRATLHDCDDGSDANPVRLGQTVLGSN